MAQTRRNSVQDFMSAVRTAPNAATGKYGANLNSDGTVQIVIAATGQVIWQNVFWQMGPNGPATDANISGDIVRLYGNNQGSTVGGGATVASGDAQMFLNSLT